MRQHHRCAAGRTQVRREPGRASHVRPVIRSPGNDHVANSCPAPAPRSGGLGGPAEGRISWADCMSPDPAGRLLQIAHGHQHPLHRQVLKRRRNGGLRSLLFAKQESAHQCLPPESCRGSRPPDHRPSPRRLRGTGSRTVSLPSRWLSWDGCRFAALPAIALAAWRRVSVGRDVASTIGRGPGARESNHWASRVGGLLSAMTKGLGPDLPQMRGRRGRQGHGPWLVFGGKDPWNIDRRRDR